MDAIYVKARLGHHIVSRAVLVATGSPPMATGKFWCLEMADSEDEVFWTDYSWIDLPVFADYGLPRHERGVVESQLGLYFMGLMFQTSISSALVLGVGRDAEFITSQNSERAQTPSEATPMG